MRSVSTPTAPGTRQIYFEGTYTAAFSAATEKTPRYDYNQIMYRLALDDVRLRLPVPVYETREPNGSRRLLTGERVGQEGAWQRIVTVPFLAFDRPGPNLVPIYQGPDGALSTARRPAPDPATARPAFFALDPRVRAREKGTQPLLAGKRHEARANASRRGSGPPDAPGPNHQAPIGRVWVIPPGGLYLDRAAAPP
jgi:hypothetical protein